MTSMPQSIDMRTLRLFKALAVVGILLTAISASFMPERAWTSSFIVAYYLVTLGLGGTVFIAITNVTGAGWHVAIRRVPEALTSLLPVGGLLLLILLAFQLPRYSWHPHAEGDAGTLWLKERWLLPMFFMARAIGYLVLWVAFAWQLVHASRQQDRPTTPSPQRINICTSALFLAVFAVTFSLASVDWIMALEPMWFSTMWGVYHFSGLFQTTLAIIVIASIVLRRTGHLREILRDDHLHDLGKLLIGFSCFWMYIWFCQYMLIWYSNIPEETVYFSSRIHGSWGPMIIASVILNWVIPFFTLLPRRSKRSETVMLRVAMIMLIGRWVDLSVMIYPPVIADAPSLGIPEISATIGGIGLVGWRFLGVFSQANSAPRNDPLLPASLTYTN